MKGYEGSLQIDKYCMPAWSSITSGPTGLASIITTELYYSWNRNTAVLLYYLLLGHGEWKWLAHMINPIIIPYDTFFSNIWLLIWFTYCLVFSTGLDWF